MHDIERRQIQVRGTVQGVGFRPFVYRLAMDLGLAGWVRNTDQGVFIEAEGKRAQLDDLLEKLRREAPPLSRVSELTSVTVPLAEYRGFSILGSTAIQAASTLIPPDIAPCEACVRELLDPANRRYRYPFINCVNCGPRFTIVRALPYDRPLTTMQPFLMCGACEEEYHDPANRRFHAQPNACPACGPRIWIATSTPEAENHRRDPIAAAASALRDGKIVAIKGIGGFHLACNARDEDAVMRLRSRKHREQKPFALMVRNLEAASALCDVSDAEAELLLAADRPIVLLERRTNTNIARAAAPASRLLGIMLPSSPLHHLLLHDVDLPLVMTSGNLSEEPIAFENAEAMERLGTIAELTLLHDREIHTPCDDSVVSLIAGAPTLLRRGRGHTLEPMELPFEVSPLLAMGSDLKGSIAVAEDRKVYLSQHLGDLSCLAAENSLKRAFEHLQELTHISPEIVAHDLHPDYASTRLARELGGSSARLFAVQHHHAHVASCMAENGLPDEKVIGIALDGAGLGPDGTIWGGEVLIADYEGFERAIHLRNVPLPGGDAAAREPWRMAVAHLLAAGCLHPDEEESWRGLRFADEAGEQRLRALMQLIARGVQCVPTSSCGRLFDAVAAITGLCAFNRFEGEAAMKLEQAAHRGDCGRYEFTIEGGAIRLRTMFGEILQELRDDVGVGIISARFHATVAEAFSEAASLVREQHPYLPHVCLSGGCLQNALLARELRSRLERREFSVFMHKRVPPNDGGIALGQAVVAAAKSARGTS